jgi:hypothetical protein
LHPTKVRSPKGAALWQDEKFSTASRNTSTHSALPRGKGFRLKNFDPGDTCGLKLDKGVAAELLARGTEWLAEEQEMLYAQDRWSLLLVFQAMDARKVHSLIDKVYKRKNFGATSGAYPSAGASASSTVRTTRRSWSCACTRRS